MNWREAVVAVVVAMGLGVCGACSVDGSGIGILDPGDGPRTDATGGSGAGGTGAAGAGGTGMGGTGGTGGSRSDGPTPDRAVEAGEGGVVLPADGPTEPYANGWPCTDPNGCTSGFCVDNVCCETRCGGILRGLLTGQDRTLRWRVSPHPLGSRSRRGVRARRDRLRAQRGLQRQWQLRAGACRPRLWQLVLQRECCHATPTL